MAKVQQQATKCKRSSRGMGRLFKKAGAKQYPSDSTVKGNYYLTYNVSGKRITKALRDAANQPITDRAQAEAERKRILAPFAAGGEVEALQAVTAQLNSAEIKRAAAEAEANPPPELEQIWNKFIESPARPDSGESTLRVYNFKWGRFLEWLEKNYPAIIYLHEVTPAIASDYAKNLTAEKLSASTFNQHRNLLRMVWRALAAECRLTTNPWDGFRPKKLTTLATRKHALTPAQFESLLAKVKNDEDLHDLFMLLAWTGLRLADGVLIKWGSVDFSRKVITVTPVKTARRQGKQVHIPIFPAAAEVLNRRQEGKLLNPKRFVFPKLADKYERDATAISKSITDAFKLAGMETTEKRANLSRKVVVYGAHSLRHLFVTAATAAGFPAAMIKSITGHSTDGMLEHYQQIGADLAADLAGRIQGTALIPESTREPLPDWAKKQLEEMTAENWNTVRAEMLKDTAKSSANGKG